MLEVLNIKVDHLLKFILHPLQLIILLLHIVVVGLFLLLQDTLKAVDLVIFLCAQFLYTLADYVLDGLFLLQGFLQLVDLVHHVLLALLILRAHLLLIQFYGLCAADSLIFKVNLTLVLTLVKSVFPLCDLLH